MKIFVEHRTSLEYSADVVESVMDARLGPRTDEHQRWGAFELKVSPSAAIRRYADGFGNVAHLITVAKPHRTIDVVMRGEIETTLADPFQPPRARPTALAPGHAADYLGPSPLVPRVAELDTTAAPIAGAGEAPFEIVQKLMHVVFERFDYRSDVTTVATTVPDVLAHRTGVCQDFAHVLIGLCRTVGIPARYVSGYILAGSDRAAPKRGAGASHAWVEAFTPTHGWRGFDPTNDLMASEHHVKMAVGRDYRDVPPT
ncbi:MAG TPA: transglutaminase family protein, partial [Candidatus Limnocylindria bacterium]|nr:transglutaminase family protein [Candidatus Limnocylindria bacterium]